MYKDNKDGISVKLGYDDRSTNKEGLYPIKIQVIHLRKVRMYGTGKYVTKLDWEKLADSRTPTLSEIRRSVKDSFDRVVRNIEELVSKGEFSFDILNVRLVRESGGTLNSALKTKIASLEQEGRIGTMFYYQSVLRSIETYTKAEVPFEAVTVEWLKKIENYQVRNDIKYATIGMRMRGIRHMMNKTKRDGIIKETQHPLWPG